MISMRNSLIILSVAICVLSPVCKGDNLTTDSSRTDIPYYPSDRLAHFKIIAKQSETDLASIMQRIFESPNDMGATFACHRYGSNNNSVSCLLAQHSDLFEARFESKDNSVTLKLTVTPSANLDRSYKPNYQLFDTLNSSLYAALTRHFGVTNVNAGR